MNLTCRVDPGRVRHISRRRNSLAFAAGTWHGRNDLLHFLKAAHNLRVPFGGELEQLAKLVLQLVNEVFELVVVLRHAALDVLLLDGVAVVGLEPLLLLGSSSHASNGKFFGSVM